MENLLEGITWLGHASFRIEAPEGVIYIDPWKLKDGVPADLILISHGHYDHFSTEDLHMILKADTAIVSVAEVTAQLQGDVTTVTAGESVIVKGVQIEVVPAYTPHKQFHPQPAGGVGFIITAGGRRIYHAGDTDAIPEMADIRADVALLPAGGKYTMNASEAAQAASMIQPAVAVPMHWGDIVGSRADAEAFRDQCQVPVEILEPQ